MLRGLRNRISWVHWCVFKKLIVASSCKEKRLDSFNYETLMLKLDNTSTKEEHDKLDQTTQVP
jgi:hypothetical protein